MVHDYCRPTVAIAHTLHLLARSSDCLVLFHGALLARVEYISTDLLCNVTIVILVVDCGFADTIR